MPFRISIPIPLCAVAMLFLAAPVAGQYMDFGTSLPKLGKETQDAGIASYHLERLEAGDYRMELFDTEGASITICSIEDEDGAQTIRCSLEEKEYRFFYSEKGKIATFEEVATGEHITITGSPAPPVSPEVITPKPGEPLPRPEPPDLSATGTKTVAEAEEEWGQVSKVLQMALAEWQATLRGTRSTSAAPQGAIQCPQGADPRCGPDVVAGAADFVLGDTECCTRASRVADTNCRLHTSSGCCANTFCNVGCIFVVCSCDLFGILWSCPVCI